MPNPGAREARDARSRHTALQGRGPVLLDLQIKELQVLIEEPRRFGVGARAALPLGDGALALPREVNVGVAPRKDGLGAVAVLVSRCLRDLGRLGAFKPVLPAQMRVKSGRVAELPAHGADLHSDLHRRGSSHSLHELQEFLGILWRISPILP